MIQSLSWSPSSVICQLWKSEANCSLIICCDLVLVLLCTRLISNTNLRSLRWHNGRHWHNFPHNSIGSFLNPSGSKDTCLSIFQGWSPYISFFEKRRSTTEGSQTSTLAVMSVSDWSRKQEQAWARIGVNIIDDICTLTAIRENKKKSHKNQFFNLADW